MYLSVVWELLILQTASLLAGLLALLDENEQDLKVCFTFIQFAYYLILATLYSCICKSSLFVWIWTFVYVLYLRQVFALKNLHHIVDVFWAEISESVEKM